jgi:type VII secretion integral membrane protein EccD
MEQNTTRIALSVDGRRVDLAVPARRPIAEFLPQLVDLAGPEEQRVSMGWHLMRVGGDLLDPERTLADAAVLDGELIQLAPALAAPNGADVVDDVPAAVTAAAAPHRRTQWTRSHVCHAFGAAAAVGLSLSLAAGAVAGGIVAAVVALGVLAGATLLQMSGREVDASIWAFTAIVPAAVAGWTLGRNTQIEVWWAPAVIAAAIAAIGAAVAVPARHAVLVPLAAGLGAAAAWCGVFAAGIREPGAVGGPAVILGVVIVDIVPRASFHALGVGRLHRGPRTRQAVDDRVQRSRSMMVAGNVTGGVLIVIGAASLAAGDDPWGWGLAALAALVLALHTRLYTNLDEKVPVAAAAMAVLTLMLVLTVLPEAGWPIAAGASAVPALALAAVGVRPLHVRPLTRRRLARAEAICALPLIVTALMSSGLGETLFRSGQDLV